MVIDRTDEALPQDPQPGQQYLKAKCSATGRCAEEVEEGEDPRCISVE
jgi:hypothetical protein